MNSSEQIQQIVQQAKEGDEQAFNELVKTYNARVRKIISRYIKDNAEVHDLTQETFIKVYHALPTFRGECQFYTWLYRIAVNTAKNYCVYCRRHTPLTDIDYEVAQTKNRNVLREMDSPERELIRVQVEQHIQEILAEMPEDLRAVLLLRDIDDMPYEAIASMLHCPVGTIRSRIFRARELFSQQLASAS